MKILAPAKINLFLEVLGRRKDGYHNIETIFQTIDLFDTIDIEETERDISVFCSQKDIPQDERNLAYKAAILVRKHFNIKKGVSISIEKRIPVGAGLGGGSSDAASVIKGLIKLWNIKTNYKELIDISLKIGADVPFFLRWGTAVGQGIGQDLTYIKNVAPSYYILVYPRIKISTKYVYGKIQLPLTKIQKINKIKKLLTSSASPNLWSKYMFNRLEDIVIKEVPEVKRIKDFFSKNGYYSLMSGSGSCVFAVISSLEEGEILQSQIRRGYPWDVWRVKSFERYPRIKAS